MPIRSFQPLASNPISISFPRSGPRLGLPIVFGVTAAASAGPEDGRYVLIDEYAVGALPDWPYAPRSRNSPRWLPIIGILNHDSSLNTQLSETFGYTTRSNDAPNALWSSERTAPVRKNRSRQPTCSCT